MDDSHLLDFEDLPAAAKRQVNEACERFEAALHAGRPAPLDEFLSAADEPLRPVLFRELLLLECEETFCALAV